MNKQIFLISFLEFLMAYFLKESKPTILILGRILLISYNKNALPQPTSSNELSIIKFIN